MYFRSVFSGRSARGPHQLQASIGARSYRALEWLQFPLNMHQLQLSQTRELGSQNRPRETAKYLKIVLSLYLASSFSFNGAPISKRVRIQATLRKIARVAKNLPGQILLGVTFQHSRGGTWPGGNQKIIVTGPVPSPCPEYALFGILDERIEFSIFKEPSRVKAFRHRVDGLIAEHFPT